CAVVITIRYLLILLSYVDTKIPKMPGVIVRFDVRQAFLLCPSPGLVHPQETLFHSFLAYTRCSSTTKGRSISICLNADFTVSASSARNNSFKFGPASCV